MARKRRLSNTDVAPTKKRTRGGRNKRVVIEGMPEMPLDILFLARRPFPEF